MRRRGAGVQLGPGVRELELWMVPSRGPDFVPRGGAVERGRGGAL